MFLYDIVYGYSGEKDLNISLLIFLPNAWEKSVEGSEMSLKGQMLMQL